MSFERHRQIYQSDGPWAGRETSPALEKPGATLAAAPGAHRLDEFAAGYSLAGCSPAEPASASPAQASVRRYSEEGKRFAVNRNLSRFRLSHAWGSLHYRSVAAIRGVALDLGRRLAASGALGTSADVFMLEMDELRNLATGKTERGGFSGIIAERRALYRRLLAACRSGSSIESAAGRKQELAAESCSRGIGVGPARLVRGFGELSRIQPGDILVCKQFRPAWTSVFSRVAGVAVELGGTLSHGSILAREYGVPMVINVPQLCANVHDGDWITVDSSRGRDCCS